MEGAKWSEVSGWHSTEWGAAHENVDPALEWQVAPHPENRSTRG